MRAKHACLWVAITLVAVGLPELAEAGDRTLGYSAFASASPFGAMDYPSDGVGPSATGIVELGIGGSASYRIGRWFEVGLGARYDNCRYYRAHFITLPVTAAAVIPLGRWGELRPGVGIGPGLGFLPGYAANDGVLRVFGPSVEIGLGYTQMIKGDRLAVLVQVGARLDGLGETNAEPGSYLAHGSLRNLQLPFVRVGVDWH